MFLYSVGPAAVRIYNGLDMSEEDHKSLSAIIKALEEDCLGETIEMYEQYVFNSRNQKDGETIEEYITEVCTLAQSCNFCACLQDMLIQDRIVLGISDTAARKL